MHFFCEIVGLVLLSLVCCFLDKDALLFSWLLLLLVLSHHLLMT